MIFCVADTHAVVWYLSGDTRLSITARQFMETNAMSGRQVGISSISLVEIVYLIEKGRIPAESLTDLAFRLDKPKSMFAEIPVTLIIARSVSRLSASQIPDMPDRIIAATALHLNVPLISRDGKIQLSSVQTLW
jgi:PIN domain nuclease of toxin-antitoxin system